MTMKAIVLDFDGTIVESVPIKDEAFDKLFKDYPEHLDAIGAYHLNHNATIRFEKFRYITEKILGQEYTEEIGRKLSDEFSRLVFEQIVHCPLVEGAEDFLKYFYGKVPLYLASVSPAEELDKILNARRLKHYFKNVYAFPRTKKDVIEDVVENEVAVPETIVFIGDSPEDFQAAKATGAYFIGRDSGKSLPATEAPVFKDFTGILSFVQEKMLQKK